MGSKYTKIASLGDYDILDSGYYKNEFGKLKHYGNGYAVILWGNKKEVWYVKDGNFIDKEELKLQIEIMKTPLYKAVYGN